MATFKLRTGSGAPTAALFVASEPAWDGDGNVLYIRNAGGNMAPVGAVTYSSLGAFPATGVTNTVYIAGDTGRMYQWYGGTSNKYGETGAGPGSTVTVMPRTVQALGSISTTTTLSIADVYCGQITCTLTANVAFTLPAATAPAMFDLFIVQDATGGRTPSFTSTSTITWPSGTATAQTWSTNANSFVVLRFLADGTKWLAYKLADSTPDAISSIVSWI